MLFLYEFIAYMEHRIPRHCGQQKLYLFMAYEIYLSVGVASYYLTLIM